MPLNLMMDHNVPKPITTGLRTRGIDVLTAEEDGMAQAEDSDLLARSTELKRVLFTQDDDFIQLSFERQAEGISFYGVVYAHQLKVPVGRCIEDLELIANAMTPEEVENNIFFLPL